MTAELEFTPGKPQGPKMGDRVVIFGYDALAYFDGKAWRWSHDNCLVDDKAFKQGHYPVPPTYGTLKRDRDAEIHKLHHLAYQWTEVGSAHKAAFAKGFDELRAAMRDFESAEAREKGEKK